MKRILVVNTVPYVLGGISTVIMNYYEQIDCNQFHLDFVVNDYIEPIYREIMEKRGSAIYEVKRNSSPWAYCISLIKLIKEKHYEIVYVHGNSCTMAVDLFAAMLGGCRKRIAHVHNSMCQHIVVHKVLRPLFELCCTERVACSQAAGQWLFGKKKYVILPNGIDVEKYKYCLYVRNTVRKKLGLENKFIVGHVGFFNEQKNHKRLFAIFQKLLMQNENSHLLCIAGDENIPDKYQRMIEKLNIATNVTILTQRTDVNILLMAMDVFVFPSLYEGLGVSVIEAQASGLPCIVSDRIPQEANVTNTLRYVSLQATNDEWIENINLACAERLDRCAYNERMLGGIFDINANGNRLQQLFE